MPDANRYYFTCGGEVGYEMIVGRKLILSGINRIKKKNPNAIVAVVGPTTSHVLYQSADEYIGTGYDRSRPEKVDVDGYESQDIDKESDDWSVYDIPKLKQEWESAGRGVAQSPYVTICARYRGEEGDRNFHYWDKIVGSVSELGYRIICVTPRCGSPKLNVPYLEDFIGERNPDRLGIELALHREADLCITTNTGGTGIMLLSNARKVFLFGGLFGFRPGFDGVHAHLALKSCYRTRFIDANIRYRGLDIDSHGLIADRVIEMIRGELKAQ